MCRGESPKMRHQLNNSHVSAAQRELSIKVKEQIKPQIKLKIKKNTSVFFSFIDGWLTNDKSAYRHLLCVVCKVSMLRCRSLNEKWALVREFGPLMVYQFNSWPCEVFSSPTDVHPVCVLASSPSCDSKYLLIIHHRNNKGYPLPFIP